MPYIRDSQFKSVIPAYTDAFVETRTLLFKGGNWPGEHTLYLGNIADPFAIANVRVSPAYAISKALLVKEDIIHNSSDVLTMKIKDIEESHLHKFVGDSATFGCTSNGNCLPTSDGYEYAIVLEWDPSVDIQVSYDIVLLDIFQNSDRICSSFMLEAMADYGISTPGMKKYTLPVHLDGNTFKLIAFVPHDTVSVQLFMNDVEYGCPFVVRPVYDGALSYVFDMKDYEMEFNEKAGAYIVIQTSGDTEAQVVHMGLIGLQRQTTYTINR